MIILIHIVIALASIVIASFTLLKPDFKKLVVSYGFIIATITSGTLLLITAPSHILQSCMVGLGYLTAVSIVTIATHYRLRRINQSI